MGLTDLLLGFLWRLTCFPSCMIRELCMFLQTRRVCDTCPCAPGRPSRCCGITATPGRPPTTTSRDTATSASKVSPTRAQGREGSHRRSCGSLNEKMLWLLMDLLTCSGRNLLTKGILITVMCCADQLQWSFLICPV